MTPVVATARQNAVALDDGEARLRLGKSIFELQHPLEIAGEKLSSALLSFSIRPEPPFLGQRPSLAVWWQDVPAGVFDLNAFGPTRIRLPLRNLASPSRLTLEVDFARNEAFYAGNFDAFTLDCATVGNFAIEPVAIADDPRFALVPIARKLAQELGLQGEYLRDLQRLAPLQDAVISALRGGRGFSLVRLGDGEGRVLNYPTHFSDLDVLNSVLYYHFGPESMDWVKASAQGAWTSTVMVALQQLLTASLRNADAVGLPVSETMSDKALSNDAFGALGYATALLTGLSLTRHIPASLRYGVNVFQQAAGKGLLFREAAQAARAVYLVGPWDLTEPFAASVGLETAHHIRVPGHYTWRGSKGFGQFPELHRFVEQRLMNLGDLSGSLLLVGAGILGKHYCNLAKSRGAVALDIGSVFDSWAQKGLPYAVSNPHVRLDKLRDQTG